MPNRPGSHLLLLQQHSSCTDAPTSLPAAQAVPSGPCCFRMLVIFSPELALGTDGILSPHLHAVEGGVGIGLSGQVAAHHLVLVVLEKALRNRINSPGQLTGQDSCSAEGAVSITMGCERSRLAACAVLCWLNFSKR